MLLFLWDDSFDRRGCFSDTVQLFTTVSKWGAVEAKSRNRTRWRTAGRALGTGGEIRSGSLAALQVAARGRRSCRLRSRAHLGSYSCSCPVLSLTWIFSFSLSALAVCWKLTYSVNQQSCLLLCTSSVILWHILVVLLACSSAQS